MKPIIRRTVIAAVAAAALASGSLLVAAPAAALPTGFTVVEGTATPNVVGDVLTVAQTSELAIIEVDSFDVTLSESVVIEAPSETALTVFRVSDATSMNIDGTVSSNGSLVLMGNQGVYLYGDASIDVAGDLLLIAGDAPNSEFSEEVIDFTISPTDGSITINSDAQAYAGRAMGLVGLWVNQDGFVHTGNGDLVLASVSDIEYMPEYHTIASSGVLDGGAVSVTGTQHARHGSVAAISPNPASLTHNGVSVGDNAGASGTSGVWLSGGITTDGLDAFAVGDFEDALGGQLGGFPYLGGPLTLTASALTGYTMGGTVPTTSTAILSGVEAGELQIPIIQASCGLEAPPLETHWAMAPPTYDGNLIVPDISVYDTPNLPGVEVPGLGTVWFNERTITDVGDYQIVELTAMRVETEGGDEHLFGVVACGVPTEHVLPVTGGNAGPVLAIALLVTLAGTALLVLRIRRTA